MTGSDWLNWAVAIVLSLLVHALVLLDTGSLAGNQELQQRVRDATRLSFRSATSPPTKPIVQSQETLPEAEVIESPEQPPETTPPTPERTAERASQVAPEPSAEMREAIASASVEEVSVPAEAVSGTVDEPALIKQAKQEYLRRLMAHIEKYKHYPRAARRRRIEGDVSVSFNLQEAGRIRGLTVAGGHDILNSAVQRAVEEAMPLPKPPPSLERPLPVAFTMRFSLY